MSILAQPSTTVKSLFVVLCTYEAPPVLEIATFAPRDPFTYNQKESKLATYDQKAKEINLILEQHKQKIESLQGKINYVLEEKEKMVQKIDPQIEALHAQMEAYKDEIEDIQDTQDRTTV